METETTRVLRASCSAQGVRVETDLDPAEVASQLESVLAKKLGQKGIDVSWQCQETNCELRIRIKRIDQGSQLLRYLLPFLAPAIVEIEGSLTLPGRDEKSLHFIENAQFGLLGGSSSSMI